jgi:peptidoglycan/LPS O-acetylase OafA/YrhL
VLTAPTPSRLRVLDLLRFVAATAVLLFHFTARDHARWAGGLPAEVFPHLAPVTRFGYLGVHLFFVISGFVVLASAWGRSTGSFVASRASRLYPAFWAAVLLTSVLRWAWPGFEARTPGEVLVNLTMLQDPLGIARVDGVYWTLWVELQFYAVVALLVRAGPTSRRVVGFAVVAPSLAAALTLVRPGVAGPWTLLEWLPLFGAGMVLCLIHRDGPRPALWCVLALDALLAAVVAAVRTPRAIDAVASGHATSAVVVAAGVVGVVALVAAATLVPRARACGPRWFTAAGLLTYPLYLTHEYVGWAAIEVLSRHLRPVPALVLASAVCLGVAALVHRTAERPFQARLRHVLDRVLDPPRPARSVCLPEIGPTEGRSRPRHTDLGVGGRVGQASWWDARL